MPYLLVILLLLGRAWPTWQPQPEPQVLFRFLTDGLAVDPKTGALASSKMLGAKFQLSKRSEERFPNLKNQPIQAKGSVSLARGSRRVVIINWELTRSIPILGDPQPGDRIIIELSAIQIRQQDGTWLTLSEKALPVYVFGLH